MQHRYHLDGIASHMVTTARGQMHVLEAGAPDGFPVLFMHGNITSSTFWEEVMLALPAHYRAIALDLRGYGDTPPQPVDATRGMSDFSDDIHSLAEALNLHQFHLVGHSMGGNVTMQYVIDHAAHVRSLTLVAPGSPYGFGGTRDTIGTPCYPDYAGSGGGLVHPEVIRRIAEGDRSNESDFSPRRLLARLCAPNTGFAWPREDMLVAAMLATSTAEDNYSRDMTPSSNWPGFAPGTRGVNNALSPKYCNLSRLATIVPSPPICWIRGASDMVVSDTAFSDPGTLGQMGILPNWPGEEVYPPQPMVGQTRALLEAYAANGGATTEIVIANVGHVPYMEDRAAFLTRWLPFLSR